MTGCTDITEKSSSIFSYLLKLPHVSPNLANLTGVRCNLHLFDLVSIRNKKMLEIKISKIGSKYFIPSKFDKDYDISRQPRYRLLSKVFISQYLIKSDDFRILTPNFSFNNPPLTPTLPTHAILKLTKPGCSPCWEAAWDYLLENSDPELVYSGRFLSGSRS